MNTRKSDRNMRMWAFVALGILLCVLASCNKQDVFLANVIISNECGLAVDVYMNGFYQFTVNNLYFKTIEDVPQGIHDFVSKKQGTEELVATISMDVNTSSDFLWIVKSPASIKVTNLFGEALDIYIDGSSLGEISDQETQIISYVDYGQHLLTAHRITDEELVNTTDIEVTESIEYVWTITL